MKKESGNQLSDFVVCWCMCAVIRPFFFSFFFSFISLHFFSLASQTLFPTWLVVLFLCSCFLLLSPLFFRCCFSSSPVFSLPARLLFLKLLRPYSAEFPFLFFAYFCFASPPVRVFGFVLFFFFFLWSHSAWPMWANYLTLSIVFSHRIIAPNKTPNQKFSL